LQFVQVLPQSGGAVVARLAWMRPEVNGRLWNHPVVGDAGFFTEIDDRCGAGITEMSTISPMQQRWLIVRQPTQITFVTTI
jgi:hypothetical protein